MSPRTSALALVLALSGCGKGDGDPTTDSATSAGTATTATTTPTTSEPSTGPGTSATTGVDVAGFERFRVSRAAGPCPPDLDCDGFVELLASRTLRVEVFGDLSDTVKEAQVSAAEFSAAVQVFTDPALLALLDGPQPLCDPPTDIFEGMLVEIDGATHEATTTTCPQPPLAAAREQASALRDAYFP